MSEATNGATYESLSDALSVANDILKPEQKKGGMTIKYIQTSGNKYVQYRLTKDEWSAITSDWVEADSNKIDSKAFFVTDGNGNMIAKIDKDGVHSVDFKVGENDASLTTAIYNEADAREQGDAVVIGLVEAEEERAKAVEETKIGYTIANDNLLITDSNGYIIFKIDKDGAHAPNLSENGEVNSDNITIQDKNGYIIARIDKNGVRSTKDKHAVACMVLSESYYPTAAPTRDSDGNVTYAKVMFETGISGSINIIYTNGNSSSVAVVYGNYNYTITINRDADGNVEIVSVN